MSSGSSGSDGCTVLHAIIKVLKQQCIEIENANNKKNANVKVTLDTAVQTDDIYMFMNDDEINEEVSSR